MKRKYLEILIKLLFFCDFEECNVYIVLFLIVIEILMKYCQYSVKSGSCNSWDEAEELAHSWSSWRQHVVQCVFDGLWSFRSAVILSAVRWINRIFACDLGEIRSGAESLSQTDWSTFVGCRKNEIQEVTAATVPSSCRRSATIQRDSTDSCSAASSGSAAATTLSTSSTPAAETGAWGSSIVSCWQQQQHATVSASTTAAAATVAG